MKRYYNAVMVIIWAVCSILYIGCGGDDDSVAIDGDTESVACTYNTDCLTTGSPMWCTTDGYCSRIACDKYPVICRYTQACAVLPLMDCREGYCEKTPCTSDSDCTYTYDPESYLRGPFECRDGYCERPVCDENHTCPPYRECYHGICRSCQSSANDMRLCKDNTIVEKRYSLLDDCSIHLDEEVVVEECADDERCVEEPVTPPQPEQPYTDVWCESLSE